MTVRVARTNAETLAFETSATDNFRPPRAEAISGLVCELETPRSGIKPNTDFIDLLRALNGKKARFAFER